MGEPRSLRQTIGAVFLGLCVSGVFTALAGQDVPRRRTTSETGAIEGFVLGITGQDTVPLAHALVEISDPRLYTRAADSTGRYILSRVPAGAVTLRIVHAGYDPVSLDVTLAPGDTLHLNALLKGRPVHLGAMDVDGKAGRLAGDATNPSAKDEIGLGIESMRSSAGFAESGLVETARRQSGSDPNDPTAILFMRGSAANLKLVLLDGAPVYAPFHMGGLLDPIEPSVVGRTRLFLGGAPAKYNGGLSHIFEIETRTPGESGSRLDADLNLMGGRVTAEGRRGSLGMLVSSRALHNLANSLFTDAQAPYNYWDLISRTEASIAPNHRVSLTLFHNEESVNLDPAAGFSALDVSPEAFAPFNPLRRAYWENSALSLRYAGQLRDTRIDFTATQTNYDAGLPLGDSTLVLFEGSSRRSHFALDLSRASRRTQWNLGASLDRMSVRDGAQLISGSANRLPGEASDEGTMAGTYAEVQHTMARGITFRGGVRADLFPTAGDRLDLSPRAVVLWPVTDRALFRLAAGRFSQLARRSDPAVESNLGLQDPEFLGRDLLTVASATHLVASLDQQLTPAVTAGIEGFVKSYEGLSELKGERLNSSGMDMRLSRNGPGETRGWLGYTLTWFWSESEALSNHRFSGHHLLNAGLSGSILNSMHGELRVAYGGLPFTAIPVTSADTPGAVEGEGLEVTRGTAAGAGPPLPDRDFLRVDLTLSGSWQVRREARRALTFTPYLKVINALDRRDALFFYFDPWRDQSARPLADLPVLPILGLRVTF